MDDITQGNLLEAIMAQGVDPATGLPRSVVTPRIRGVLGAPAQIIASRSSNPGAYAGSGVTNTGQNARLKHVAAINCSQIRLVYSNWTTAEADNPNAITVKAGIEIAGTVYPVTFNGLRTLTLDPGASVVSDPVAVEVVKGTTIWSRTYCTVTAGQSWPNTAASVSADGEAGENGTAVTDKSLTGTITNQNLAVFAPMAVLGHAQVAVPSVAIIGDSIAQGTGDTTTKNDYGFVVRALEVAPFGWVRVARGGETAQTFAAVPTAFKRRQLVAMARNALCNYGVNDVFGGRTLAQIQADLLTIWSYCSGVNQVVYQTTITPRTNSTDSWVTVGNQTTVVSGQETTRRNLNAWIRAGAPIDPTSKAAVAVGTSAALLAGTAGHPLTGYFEVTDVVESARDSGLFKAPGVSGTGDTTAASATILNATGAWQKGHAIAGTGIPANTIITAVSGSTLTLSANATATASGVTINAAHTGDGSHPSPVMHALMAAAIDTTKFS